MRVLIFNNLYYPNIIGGAEISTQILAEGLKRRGLDPIVVATAAKDEISYVNCVKIYYLRTENFYWVYKAKQENKLKKPFWHLVDSFNPLIRFKLQKIIEKENPQVIHTNNLSGFSVYVWKLATEYKLPIIHTLRDYYLLCPKSTMIKNNKNCKVQCLRCKLYSIPKKSVSKEVNTVVGISKFILDKHLNYGYFKNAEMQSYVYNPIVNDVKSITKQENIKQIKFGFVGQLSPNKGIEFLLKKFSKMNLKNVKLYVFGKGTAKEYENNLVTRYKSDNIHFMGFKKREEIYTSLNILIIPSLWEEPFGRIIPEAYSYGIPVIGSNRGGIPELIKEGKTGFIFDPDKEEDLEEKIRKFIAQPDLIPSFSKNCLNFSKGFTENKIVRKYIFLYRKMIK